MSTLSFELASIRNISLRPTHQDHARDLIVAAESAKTFQYFSAVPTPHDEQGMRSFIHDLTHVHNTIPYTVFRDDVPVGITTFLATSEKHRHTEIGFTWYAPTARGTLVNPVAKMIMLDQAFRSSEHGGFSAIRVALKTDLRNTHSQRAIEKLGAVREGVLRDIVVMPDGYYRSTVMYSILADEWPAVRDRLEARINAS